MLPVILLLTNLPQKRLAPTTPADLSLASTAPPSTAAARLKAVHEPRVQRWSFDPIATDQGEGECPWELVYTRGRMIR